MLNVVENNIIITIFRFALAWNHWRKGRLISGSYDNMVCMWDVNGTPGNKKTLQPLQTFKGHSDAVGSISWHCDEEYLFASVGDDKVILKYFN